MLVPNVDLVKQWTDAITALGRYKPLVMGESHPEIGVMRGEETCTGEEEMYAFFSISQLWCRPRGTDGQNHRYMAYASPRRGAFGDALSSVFWPRHR